MTDDTITVPASALYEQLGGIARASLFTAGGWLVAKGWLNDGLVQAIVPALITAGPLVWQQFQIIRSHASRVRMADKLPDADAVVVR